MDAGKRAESEEGGSKLKLKLLSKNNNKISFLIKGITPSYSNALRRIILTEVPVMAVEEVEFRKNSSALYDEMVAYRLGLLSLKTDLKSYELPESQADIDERKAKCTVQFTLKQKGPKTVYAEALKTADPKIKPVHPKTPIVKLLKDQEIELVATAILGKGQDHVKWSPCHVWFTNNHKLSINKNPDLDQYKKMYPPQIFDGKGKISESLILENQLVDAVAHINEDIVKVEYRDDEHIFVIESWGQLSVDEILKTALDIFNDKLNELNKLI